MQFTDAQKAALSAPLDRSNVKQREQAGRKLSYIEGWHAIAEANRIFGFDAWHRETVDIRAVNEKPRKVGKGQYERDGWAVTYIARVRVTVGTIIREGVGSGHGIDADLGLAHESAIKDAETDAMKRALMTFGNPFGLALYDKEQKDVADAPKPAPAAKPKADPKAWWSGASLAIPVAQTDDGKSDWMGWHTRMMKALRAAPDFDAVGRLVRDNQPAIVNLEKALPKAWQTLNTAIADAEARLNPMMGG